MLTYIYVENNWQFHHTKIFLIEVANLQRQLIKESARQKMFPLLNLETVSCSCPEFKGFVVTELMKK